MQTRQLYELAGQAGRARHGQLRLHPDLQSVACPVFMPVGTAATVKGLWQYQLDEIGYRLILGNTYHLSLRPGSAVIQSAGGVCSFQNWPHALLTDSGGYQVFSLAERVRFVEQGVEFASHIDGSRQLFTPTRVIDLQRDFGSHIMMVLDDCPPASADAARVRESLDRTHRWAQAAMDYYQACVAEGRIDPHRQHLFGIVQGHLSQTARLESLERIQELPFDGIAIGGLSVGESRAELHDMLAFLGEHLDPYRPRYLMGVGTIPDMLAGVENGIDMFDCVLPTRNARNGQLLTSQGKLNIRNQAHQFDQSPPDPACACRVCQNYSRSYLRHLFVSQEMAGPMMASYHNLFFYFQFMRALQESIQQGTFADFCAHWKKIPF
ncbi:MAG: tRNA guanosine(34) transglycosylase Tgt [Leptospiraceae bacterium]|nr:tRNA guanosine(34) transglycosylase Tgt [Leptospiraceae bacterium]